MDSPKRSQGSERSDGEDLGFLFYKIGQLAKRILTSIGSALSQLAAGLLLTILYIMRKSLWLLLGTLPGLFYGIYVQNKMGASYSSQMTIKANFNSAVALYGTIDFIEALIASGNTAQLAQLFSISQEQAQKLRSFSAEEIKSELIVSEMYKDNYLRVKRGSTVRQDTFWVRTMEYNVFRGLLTKNDYPYHTITAVSSDPSIFSKLQRGIINHVSETGLLQDLRKNHIDNNLAEQQLLEQSIGKLDSLRIAYNHRLMRTNDEGTPGGNQLTVMDNNSARKTPELELYDKLLELNDELKNTRLRSTTEKEIIEVLAPFSPVGKETSFLKRSIWRYTLISFLTTLVILILIGIYQYLRNFERRSSSRQKIDL
jgi:hypothetical protein